MEAPTEPNPNPNPNPNLRSLPHCLGRSNPPTVVSAIEEGD